MRGELADYPVDTMPRTWAAGRNGSHGEGFPAMIGGIISKRRLIAYSLAAAFVMLDDDGLWRR